MFKLNLHFANDLLDKALQYYYLENFKQAKEILEKILASDEKNFAANFYLGHILQLAKKIKESKNYFNKTISLTEKILKENPQNIDAKYFYGAAYGALALMEFNPFNLMKYQRIFFKCMDEVLAVDENYFLALWAKGRALAITGKENAALQYLQKAFELYPLGDIQVDLGLYYTFKMQFEKAEEHLLKALELKPSSPTVYYNLYLLYERKKDKEKAKEIKEKYEQAMQEKNL